MNDYQKLNVLNYGTNQFLKRREKIDLDKLNFIVENEDKFKNLLREDKRIKFMEGDNYNPSSVFTMAKNYLLKADKNGIIEVDYIQKRGVGRFCAIGSLSLQNITRQIRQTIAMDTYVDIDIKNCHPNLLLFICDNLNIPCDILRKYCNNRDDFFKKNKLSKEQGKITFLSIINGGRKEYKNIENPTPELTEFFSNEILLIHDKISEYHHTEFKQHCLNKIAGGKKWNHKASFMNIILCDIENKILQVMSKFFGNQELEVLCFDGLMLPIDHPNLSTDDFKKCEDLIYDELGILIEITKKDFEEFFELPTSIPKYIFVEDHTDIFKEVCKSDFCKYYTYKDLPYKKRTDEQRTFIKNIETRLIDNQIEYLFELKENPYVKIETYDEKTCWVCDDIYTNESRVIGIKAGLGRGKTQSMIRQVQNLELGKKVLIISPRITFSKNICDEYNRNLPKDKQFVNYYDYKRSGNTLSNLNFKHYVVISVESLHYLDKFDADLLILDEFNANLISLVSSETNGKNLDNNIYQFIRFITTAKRVIAGDAFLGSKATQFFEDIKIPIQIFDFKKKLEKRTADIIYKNNKDGTTIGSWDNYPSPSDNKNIYHYISCKKDLENIQSLYPENRKGLFYSSSSMEEIPNDLNSVWSQYNDVNTTATISVGCSCTLPDHFDTIEMYYRSVSNNLISDAIQCHYRVRHIKSDKIFVAVDSGIIVDYPVSKQKIIKELDAKARWFRTKYKGFGDIEPFIKNLIVHKEIESRLSIHSSFKMMKRYLIECNYDIQINTLDPLDPLEDLVIEIPIGETSYDFENLEIETEPTTEDILFKDLDDIITMSDDTPNIINEYLSIKVDIDNVDKLKRKKFQGFKLTPEETAILNKYWFWVIYGSLTTDVMNKLPTISLAYSIWKSKFEGEPFIRQMRLEKSILEGGMSVEQLAEKYYDKHSVAHLHKNDIRKVNAMVEICKAIGLKHSNDTNTIITHEMMEKFYHDHQGNFKSWQKDLVIQDKRKNKSVVTRKCLAGLLKSSFTHSHSVCSLKEIDSRKPIVNGKRETQTDYKLTIAKKNILRKVAFENNMICDDELPIQLYDNLLLTKQDSNVIPKSLLQDL